MKADRKPVKADNPFVELEYSLSDFMIKWLNQYRNTRDRPIERKFRATYENPLMQCFCTPVPGAEENGVIPEAGDGGSEDKR